MYLDEQQAQQKWCPFSRVLYLGTNSFTSFNRHGDTSLPIAAMCIGAACMAWRKEPEYYHCGTCALMNGGPK